MVLVPRCYHQLCVTVEVFGLVLFHPVEDAAVGMLGADVETFECVGIPLLYVYALKVGVGTQLYPKPIY